MHKIQLKKNDHVVVIRGKDKVIVAPRCAEVDARVGGFR